MNKRTLSPEELATLSEFVRQRRREAAPAEAQSTSQRTSARAQFFAQANMGQAFLKDAISWAVAGDVLNPSMPASRVVSSLKGAGKTVHLVNPHNKACNKDLNVIGQPIDALNLCINPWNGMELAKQAVRLGVKRVFIQPGAESAEIMKLLTSNDIDVFQGCVMVELGRS